MHGQQNLKKNKYSCG